MFELEINPDHPRLKLYLRDIRKVLEAETGGLSLAKSFSSLLKYFAKQAKWTFAEHFPVMASDRIQYVSGAVIDEYNLTQGIWIYLEKDADDDRDISVLTGSGFPLRNTLFQSEKRLVLWRRGKKMIDAHADSAQDLVSILITFFKSPLKNYTSLENLSDRFMEEGPIMIKQWVETVRNEIKTNHRFNNAFDLFKKSMQNSSGFELYTGLLEDLIVQYLLIRRLCDKIFKRSSFITSTKISRDIEKLLVKSASVRTFPPLIRELGSIIRDVSTYLNDHDEQILFIQGLIQKFYPEKGKKGLTVYYKSATRKIFARFLTQSIDFLLRREFNRSVSDDGVFILNPFCTSGIFMRQLIAETDRKRIHHKYSREFFAHETRLLPYFISLINIESEYLTITGKYISFPGLSMIDTLNITDDSSLSFYTDDNLKEIERQKKIPFSVIFGETPTGADDLPGKKRGGYPAIEKRVFFTYANASQARNKSVISDTYVKAIRWASDKIEENNQGIVALICKNNFIADLAFDGLRKHLVKDFDRIYVLEFFKNGDQPGHQFTGGEKAILILIKNKKSNQRGIFYQRLEWEKFQQSVFDQHKVDLFKNLKWRELKPDKYHTWLTEGLQGDFDSLLPMGTKLSKTGKEYAIFRIYGRGVATARDAWIYNFSQENLANNIRELLRVYNKYLQNWSGLPSKPDINEYLGVDNTSIPWSASLKSYLQRQLMIRYDPKNIRDALYRPFVRKYIYFEQHLIDRWYQIPHMLPTTMSERENRVICVSSPGSKQLAYFISNMIPDLNLFAGASPVQCFPLYHYDKNGQNRRENISDWALDKFINHYKDPNITKFDIFHYVYAVLQHPAFIRKYAANLRKQLPRIPFTTHFHQLSNAGKNLARLHLFYEGQAEYPLKKNFSVGYNPDWEIEKIVLSKDRRNIKINDYITLSNIPSKAFDYLIGTRSPLEWVIEQNRKKAILVNGSSDEPNRPGDPMYIYRLIAQVITVSLESIKIIDSLASLE